MVKRKRHNYNKNKNTFTSKRTRYEEEMEEEESEESVEGKKEGRIEEEEGRIEREEGRIKEEEGRMEEEEGRIEREENNEEKETESKKEIEGEDETEEEEETEGEEEITDVSENENDQTNNKDNKDRSFVWSHFEKITDDNGIKWARCKYCSNVKYKMDGKTCSSTGNLSRHLKSHMDKINLSTKKQADFMKKFLTQDTDERIPYSDEIFREKLAIWITIDDQPFTVTECQEFKELVKVCNEKAELPSADTVRKDVLKLYNKYRIDVKHMLQNVLGKLSFTLDCWTSTNNIAFLGITCHFVDVDWCLKETLVDFIHLSGSHSGENLAKEFLKSIDEDFNILTKIMTITADNAANNNTFLRKLEYVCRQKEVKFDHKKNNIRCLAHIINLTVQEILKNIKAGDAQEEDELLELVSQEEQEDNVNVEIIPKLRRLIVKIRSSPQQKEKFARRCEFFSIQSLNVILDVKTRWNSTYLMLDRILKLREVSKFIIL
ncbi:hypothetical protein RirG_186940 [Rhizophagus irregularis DAOM 197198w]|uniref:BED-type domain-containing protein n=1 Tax=Rhizophagus irregularis (strain DAOM 197198w) TaxID=1432141 RepID=A0A015KJ47_RHIIW|nr:hypothetical protein RirG_186940 [Rhizophagus irregularis DAOM 197198w]